MVKFKEEQEKIINLMTSYIKEGDIHIPKDLKKKVKYVIKAINELKFEEADIIFRHIAEEQNFRIDYADVVSIMAFNQASEGELFAEIQEDEFKT